MHNTGVDADHADAEMPTPVPRPGRVVYLFLTTASRDKKWLVYGPVHLVAPLVPFIQTNDVTARL